jgi:hypothetical protein
MSVIVFAACSNDSRGADSDSTSSAISEEIPAAAEPDSELYCVSDPDTRLYGFIDKTGPRSI